MDFFQKISGFIHQKKEKEEIDGQCEDADVHYIDDGESEQDPGRKPFSHPGHQDLLKFKDPQVTDSGSFTLAGDEPYELPELFQPLFSAFLQDRNDYIAMFFDPEEEECFLYYYNDRIMREIGGIRRDQWDPLVKQFKKLDMKKIILDGNLYLMGLVVSFSDFGERISALLCPSGESSEGALKEQKKSCIRIVNALKPATSLTHLHKIHLTRFVEKEKEGRELRFADTMRSEAMITGDTLAVYEKIAQDKGQSLESIIIGSGVFPRKRLADVVAKWLELPYVDIEEELVEMSLFVRAGPSLCRENLILPFRERSSELCVTAAFPSEDAPVKDLEQIFQKKLIVHMSAEEDIKSKIRGLLKDLCPGEALSLYEKPPQTEEMPQTEVTPQAEETPHKSGDEQKWHIKKRVRFK